MRRANSKRGNATRRDPNLPLRVVIVTRLSKAKIVKSSDGTSRRDEVSHETQEAGCRAKVAALGGEVIAVYRDTQSGDRLDRDGLWDAVARIKAGEADMLMTYSVDRLGRNQIQQAVIVSAVRSAGIGCDVLSATEDLEAGPIGDHMRSVYALAAEIDLEKIRERTNRALHAKFRQTGRYKPGQRPPYGYQKIGSGFAATYVVNDAEAAIVRRIFAEAAAGVSRRQIAAGLNRDRIPTPTGRGLWGNTSIVTILNRAVYWTGEHEVWRTRTERDADGIPFLEDRAADERYVVAFPALIGPAQAERAHLAAARNVSATRRADRPAEEGLLRYGFARCASCGRSLSVTHNNGTAQYKCTHHRHATRPCPAPVVLNLSPADGKVWWWVIDTIADPRSAPAYAIRPETAATDPNLLARLAAAEATVADLTGRAAALADNLALVTGPAARLTADRLNALNDDLGAAIAERDALAAAADRAANPPTPRIDPIDALAASALAAFEAMWAADPEPQYTFRRLVAFKVGEDWTHEAIELPNSWAAKRAALSALEVTVTVNRSDADAPRWIAEMRLPGGAVTGTWERGRAAYMDGSRR